MEKTTFGAISTDDDYAISHENDFTTIIPSVIVQIPFVMPFLSDEQLEHLRIERMIFHVVGPEDGQLVLLEEMDPGEHEEFFLGRIKAANTGILFDFLERSPVLASLRAIDATPDSFVAETKELAALFKTGHGQSTSPGAFFVFALAAGQDRFYALIKYDHEKVLSYTVRATDHGNQALIAALTETFVQSPQALQKSAILQLTTTGGELSVKDRSAPTKISQYFRQFLGAKRRFTTTDLTEKLCTIARDVGKKNNDVIPPGILRTLNQRVYDAVQTLTGFDPENNEPFLAAVFGPLPEDSKVRKEFEKALRRERIDSESFDFDRTAIRRPAKKHIVTNEGIEVIWDRQYDDCVRQTDLPNGHTQITIETGGVKVDDDYAESRTRVG